MQDAASGLRRTPLPRTRVNNEGKGLQRMSLDDQGEAVAVAEAEAVAVVAGAVFSGAGTVFSGAGTGFSGAGTGFSIVTVRAGGRGMAAPSRSPPMRPMRN